MNLDTARRLGVAVEEALHNAIHGLDHDEARFAEALEVIVLLTRAPEPVSFAGRFFTLEGARLGVVSSNNDQYQDAVAAVQEAGATTVLIPTPQPSQSFPYLSSMMLPISSAHKPWWSGATRALP